MTSFRTLLLLGAALLSSTASAAGFTNWAVPTSVEMVQGGVLIEGNFGNPHSCGTSGYIYVPSTHASLKEIVALALTALSSAREMRFYAGACFYVGFHAINVNENQQGHAARIR